MNNISTDKAIELLLYAVAEKTKIGIDMESSVNVAREEIFSLWKRDMIEIEALSALSESLCHE
jgi:sRNA-binding carbon storage regulator CsrA